MRSLSKSLRLRQQQLLGRHRRVPLPLPGARQFVKVALLGKLYKRHWTLPFALHVRKQARFVLLPRTSLTKLYLRYLMPLPFLPWLE